MYSQLIRSASGAASCIPCSIADRDACRISHGSLPEHLGQSMWPSPTAEIALRQVVDRSPWVILINPPSSGTEEKMVLTVS